MYKVYTRIVVTVTIIRPILGLIQQYFSSSLKLLNDAIVDETEGAAARHIVTCLVIFSVIRLVVLKPLILYHF
jgi:hypothetical protein